jgi:hypothetical protein
VYHSPEQKQPCGPTQQATDVLPALLTAKTLTAASLLCCQPAGQWHHTLQAQGAAGSALPGREGSCLSCFGGCAELLAHLCPAPAAPGWPAGAGRSQHSSSCSSTLMARYSAGAAAVRCLGHVSVGVHGGKACVPNDRVSTRCVGGAIYWHECSSATPAEVIICRVVKVQCTHESLPLCMCRQYVPRAWMPKTAVSTQTDSSDLQAAQLLMDTLQLESKAQQEGTQKAADVPAQLEPQPSGTARQYSTNPFAVSDCCWCRRWFLL